MDKLYQEQEQKSSPAPAFYAVIPASVRYDDQIPAAAKLLYGEISALANRDGFCWASNSYFAELYKASERNVARLIQSLEKQGYITITATRHPVTGQTVGRRIRLRETVVVTRGDDKNVTPIGQNCPDPMTFLSGPTLLENNINNNKGESIPKTIPKGSEAALDEQMNAWVMESLRFSNTVTQMKVVEKIVEFRQHRKEMKHPFTKKGITQFLNKLNQLAANQPELMIRLMDEAMERGWRTVFPPKEGPGQAPRPTQRNERQEWL